jgi:hypothetical protein
MPFHALAGRMIETAHEFMALTWKVLPHVLRNRRSNPRSPERFLLGPAPGTAIVEPPIHHNGGHGSDPQSLCAFRDLRVSHVKSLDFA